MVATPNPATVVGFTDRLNPLGSPSAPLQTRALLASYSPSLMPRAGWHQGVAVGLSLLAAESVGHLVNTSIDRALGRDAPLRGPIGRQGRCGRGGSRHRADG